MSDVSRVIRAALASLDHASYALETAHDDDVVEQHRQMAHARTVEASHALFELLVALEKLEEKKNGHTSIPTKRKRLAP